MISRCKASCQKIIFKKEMTKLELRGGVHRTIFLMTGHITNNNRKKMNLEPKQRF